MIRIRLRRRALGALIAVVLPPLPAHAHTPIEGLGTFYSHLLHPLSVLSHALLLISVGIMLGQQGRARARRALMVLAGAFMFGLAAESSTSINIVREPMLILAALTIGAAVSLDWRLPDLATSSLAAYSGLLVGLDSGPGLAGLRETALATAGVTMGVMYLTTTIAGALVALDKPWQRVGIRIVGSWIVAVSILVLALSIVGPVKHAVTGMG